MKLKYWAWILLIAGISSYVGFTVYKKVKSGKAYYRPVKAVSGDIDWVITATGTVTPQNRLEIKPPIAGRIEDIKVVEGQYVQKGMILAWMSSTDRAALMDAARANGEKELSEWQGLYKPTPVLAPLSGLVIANNIVRGQTVTAQDILIVLSDILIVKGQIDETDLGHIRLGARANIVLDAYPQVSVPGKVKHIAFEAKTINNVTVYEVEVLPLAPYKNMRSGMSATLSFIIDSRKNTTLLPVSALISEGDQYFVLKNGKVRGAKPIKIEVETGLNNGRNVEILKGVNVGETVFIAEKFRDKNASSSSPLSPMGGRRR